MDQYERYVNRFGPGLVIYWHGHLAGLASPDAPVLLLDRFPPPADVLTLPRLPLSLAQRPLPPLGSSEGGGRAAGGKGGSEGGDGGGDGGSRGCDQHVADPDVLLD